MGDRRWAGVGSGPGPGPRAGRSSSSSGSSSGGRKRPRQSQAGREMRPDEAEMMAYLQLPGSLIREYARMGVRQLHTWQRDCLCETEALTGRSLMYCAPTAGGKSLVAELLALRHVFVGKKVIFVLPFVSCVSEKTASLHRIFQAFNADPARAGPKKKVLAFHGEQTHRGTLDGVDIAVATIEKAHVLVKRLFSPVSARELVGGPAVAGNPVAGAWQQPVGADDQAPRRGLQQIGAIVVDEMHMIGNEDRGYLLELIVSMCHLHNAEQRQRQRQARATSRYGDAVTLPAHAEIQIVGMSATLPNLSGLARWMGADLYKTTFRPTTLTEKILLWTKLSRSDAVGSAAASQSSTTTIQFDMFVHSDAPGCAVGAYTQIDRATLTPEEMQGMPPDTFAIIWQTRVAVQQQLQVLVFCATRNSTESCAARIASDLKQHQVAPSAAHMPTAAALDEAEPSVALLQTCFQSGVAFHHAGLSGADRELVETRYREKRIRVIVATTSLAAGVNLPADLVLFRTMRFFGPHGLHRLDAVQYKQMCGRAGRAGMGNADKACSVLLASSRAELEHGLALMRAPLPPMYSALWRPSPRQPVPLQASCSPDRHKQRLKRRACDNDTETDNDHGNDHDSMEKRVSVAGSPLRRALIDFLATRALRNTTRPALERVLRTTLLWQQGGGHPPHQFQGAASEAEGAGSFPSPSDPETVGQQLLRIAEVALRQLLNVGCIEETPRLSSQVSAAGSGSGAATASRAAKTADPRASTRIRSSDSRWSLPKHVQLTPLGRGIFAAGIDPDTAVFAAKELARTKHHRAGVHLSSDLHLLYFVTPITDLPPCDPAVLLQFVGPAKRGLVKDLLQRIGAWSNLVTGSYGEGQPLPEAERKAKLHSLSKTDPIALLEMQTAEWLAMSSPSSAVALPSSQHPSSWADAATFQHVEVAPALQVFRGRRMLGALVLQCCCECGFQYEVVSARLGKVMTTGQIASLHTSALAILSAMTKLCNAMRWDVLAELLQKIEGSLNKRLPERLRPLMIVPGMTPTLARFLKEKVFEGATVTVASLAEVDPAWLGARMCQDTVYVPQVMDQFAVAATSLSPSAARSAAPRAAAPQTKKATAYENGASPAAPPRRRSETIGGQCALAQEVSREAHRHRVEQFAQELVRHAAAIAHHPGAHGGGLGDDGPTTDDYQDVFREHGSMTATAFPRNGEGPRVGERGCRPRSEHLRRHHWAGSERNRFVSRDRCALQDEMLEAATDRYTCEVSSEGMLVLQASALTVRSVPWEQHLQQRPQPHFPSLAARSLSLAGRVPHELGHIASAARLVERARHACDANAQTEEMVADLRFVARNEACSTSLSADPSGMPLCEDVASLDVINDLVTTPFWEIDRELSSGRSVAIPTVAAQLRLLSSWIAPHVPRLQARHTTSLGRDAFSSARRQHQTLTLSSPSSPPSGVVDDLSTSLATPADGQILEQPSQSGSEEATPVRLGASSNMTSYISRDSLHVRASRRRDLHVHDLRDIDSHSAFWDCCTRAGVVSLVLHYRQRPGLLRPHSHPYLLSYQEARQRTSAGLPHPGSTECASMRAVFAQVWDGVCTDAIQALPPLETDRPQNTGPAAELGSPSAAKGVSSAHTASDQLEAKTADRDGGVGLLERTVPGTCVSLDALDLDRDSDQEVDPDCERDSEDGGDPRVDGRSTQILTGVTLLFEADGFPREARANGQPMGDWTTPGRSHVPAQADSAFFVPLPAPLPLMWTGYKCDRCLDREVDAYMCNSGSGQEHHARAGVVNNIRFGHVAADGDGDGDGRDDVDEEEHDDDDDEEEEDDDDGGAGVSMIQEHQGMSGGWNMLPVPCIVRVCECLGFGSTLNRCRLQVVQSQEQGLECDHGREDGRRPSTSPVQGILELSNRRWVRGARLAWQKTWAEQECAEWAALRHVLSNPRTIKVASDMDTVIAALLERGVAVAGALRDPGVGDWMLYSDAATEADKRRRGFCMFHPPRVAALSPATCDASTTARFPQNVSTWGRATKPNHPLTPRAQPGLASPPLSSFSYSSSSSSSAAANTAAMAGKRRRVENHSLFAVSAPVTAASVRRKNYRAAYIAQCVLSLMYEVARYLWSEDLWNPFVTVEMPMCRVLAQMRVWGAPVSPQWLSVPRQDVQDKMPLLCLRAQHIVKHAVNLANVEEVRKALYMTLKLRPPALLEENSFYGAFGGVLAGGCVAAPAASTTGQGQSTSMASKTPAAVAAAVGNPVPEPGRMPMCRQEGGGYGGGGLLERGSLAALDRYQASFGGSRDLSSVAATVGSCGETVMSVSEQSAVQAGLRAVVESTSSWALEQLRGARSGWFADLVMEWRQLRCLGTYMANILWHTRSLPAMDHQFRVRFSCSRGATGRLHIRSPPLQHLTKEVAVRRVERRSLHAELLPHYSTLEENNPELCKDDVLGMGPVNGAVQGLLLDGAVPVVARDLPRCPSCFSGTSPKAVPSVDPSEVSNPTWAHDVVVGTLIAVASATVEEPPALLGRPGPRLVPCHCRQALKMDTRGGRHPSQCCTKAAQWSLEQLWRRDSRSTQQRRANVPRQVVVSVLPQRATTPYALSRPQLRVYPADCVYRLDADRALPRDWAKDYPPPVAPIDLPPRHGTDAGTGANHVIHDMGNPRAPSAQRQEDAAAAPSRLPPAPWDTLTRVRIQEAFAAPQGFTLVGADYAHAELRLLTHFSQDPHLLDLFNNEDVRDVFEAMAGALSGELENSTTTATTANKTLHKNVPREDEQEQEQEQERDEEETPTWRQPAHGEATVESFARVSRSTAKRLVYATMYGCGTQTVAKTLHCSLNTASKMQSRLRSCFPKLCVYLDELFEQCRAEGRVTTLLGRMRPLHFTDGDAGRRVERVRRQAISTKCQGSVADLIKLALVRVDEWLHDEGHGVASFGESGSVHRQVPGLVARFDSLPYRPILHLHDELVFEVADGMVPGFVEKIKECMEGAVQLLVPLRVRVRVGQNLHAATTSPQF